MKLLYISHYCSGTSGWAEAAKNYILALDSVGVDVVPRNVNLGNFNPILSDRLNELRLKSTSGCTHCIQHVLPHHLDYNGDFEKCVAMVATESSSVRESNWHKYLNTMDEVWTFSSSSKKCLENSVKKPIKIIPHTFDLDKYKQKYNKYDLGLGNTFKFYFIGEINRRKNLAAVVKAFHTEFARSEPVSLVLKVSKHGDSPEQLKQGTEQICSEIKKGLKIYSDIDQYKKELVLTDHLTDTQMMELHNSCDCLVAPSYEEGFGMHIFDGMAMGKTPIVTDNIGSADFISSDTGYLVDSYQDDIFGMLDGSFNNMYSSREKWWYPKISSLRKCMREAYEGDRKERVREGISVAEKYSYERIGNLILENLNG